MVEDASKEIVDGGRIILDKARKQQELLRTVDRESAAMIEGISTTAAGNMKSAKMIRELSEQVAVLERTVGRLATINTLSNMLAVTGKVESARAGEHGTGFAAVSADIRGLVDQSADQISEIAEKIRSIQETIIAVAGEVETAGIRVRQEVEKAKTSTARLVQMEDDMAEVTRGIENVRDAGTLALTATEDLKKAMDIITGGAEQASTACQQASAVAKQQTQAMAALASTAEEVAAQADEL